MVDGLSCLAASDGKDLPQNDTTGARLGALLIYLQEAFLVWVEIAADIMSIIFLGSTDTINFSSTSDYSYSTVTLLSLELWRDK